MRIIIDIQPLQTDSRYRGIGRYTSSFIRAILKKREALDVIFVMSGILPPVPAEFFEKLKAEQLNFQVVTWLAPLPVSFGNEINRSVAELLRESFIYDLRPDILVVTSLFEGYGDNAICSIKRLYDRFPTAVVLYDLIPFLNSEEYLDTDANYKRYYLERIEYLRRADLCLSISNHSKLEAIAALGLAENKVINISTAIEDDFAGAMDPERSVDKLFESLKINKRIILYIGGSDHRKNLGRLIVAFSLLPSEVRGKCQLVFAGGMAEAHVTQFYKIAEKNSLSPGDLIIAGYLRNDELIMLYKHCWLFVFPSVHEGFGLPALEAMACGAPVIGSNITSLPEVIGATEALFDPYNVEDIAAKLLDAIEDNSFRAFLLDNGVSRAQMFSWDDVAKRAIKAFESLRCSGGDSDNENRQQTLIGELANNMNTVDERTLVSVAACMAENERTALSVLPPIQ